ncbi:hypothetical protein Amet_1741 [Alkaliphilus metalliredigens QYMF]|uniref:Uncharacterized protein n=1 Tax=Alkaliphilus metalliredigens (strain QYMF) TaxID=293826 RepID=A6TNZ8_ALKMQ|nr:hypothetical protein [Alkaliphilus metalliredigens]ABR47916.1 hypothetical protein Amet_1741 [Alkaliphilus metalliredigens QYMF]
MNQTKNKPKKVIRDLIEDLGIEGTDDYFQEELKILVKNVAALREKIKALKDLGLEATNSDEIMHLNFDISDQESLLKILLTKLEILHEDYRCFLAYTEQSGKIDLI